MVGIQISPTANGSTVWPSVRVFRWLTPTPVLPTSPCPVKEVRTESGPWDCPPTVCLGEWSPPSRAIIRRRSKDPFSNGAIGRPSNPRRIWKSPLPEFSDGTRVTLRMGTKGLTTLLSAWALIMPSRAVFRLSDTLSKAGRSIEILDMAEIKTSRISSILESDWSMSFRISFHSKETVAIPL